MSSILKRKIEEYESETNAKKSKPTFDSCECVIQYEYLYYMLNAKYNISDCNGSHSKHEFRLTPTEWSFTRSNDTVIELDICSGLINNTNKFYVRIIKYVNQANEYSANALFCDNGIIQRSIFVEGFPNKSMVL